MAAEMSETNSLDDEQVEELPAPVLESNEQKGEKSPETPFSRIMRRVSNVSGLVKSSSNLARRMNKRKPSLEDDRKTSTGSENGATVVKSKLKKKGGWNGSTRIFKRKKRKESFRLVQVEDNGDENMIPIPEYINPSLLVQSDLFDIQTVPEEDGESTSRREDSRLVPDMASNYFNSDNLPKKPVLFASSVTSFGRFDIKAPVKKGDECL